MLVTLIYKSDQTFRYEVDHLAPGHARFGEVIQVQPYDTECISESATDRIEVALHFFMLHYCLCRSVKINSTNL